jgi:ankyrin repeat protein
MHSAITGRNPLEIVTILVELINQKESLGLIVPENSDDDLEASTKKLVNLADKSGVRPLYLACHTGDAKTASFLLKCGADPILARTKEASVLHVCAERDFQEICKLIVEAAPKQLIYELDGEANTALHTAAEWDN